MDRSPRKSLADDCRCLCGSLVARRVREGVELKCRRCKRVLVVPWSAGEIEPASEALARPTWGERK